MPIEVPLDRVHLRMAQDSTQATPLEGAYRSTDIQPLKNREFDFHERQGRRSVDLASLGKQIAAMGHLPQSDFEEGSRSK